MLAIPTVRTHAETESLSMTTLIRDIRFALRSFLKNPGFALAAILSTFAIGIGANTSIFSVANALLFRPLPYQDSDRLVILWNRSPGLNITEDWSPPRNTSTSRPRTTASSRSPSPLAAIST